MNRDLQKHKQSDCIKWIAVFLAVILLATGVAAALTQGFRDANPYCWFGHDYDESGKCVRCGKEKPIDEQSTGDVSAHGENLVFADVENNGINVVAEPINDVAPIAAANSQVLTATITPADATNKSVDWSVSWKNAASSWATGKTVTDYVTVTPTSDGALTATVQCLQAFGEQVVVKVTLRSNSSISATCSVDYRKKLESFTYTITDLTTSHGDSSLYGLAISSKSNYRYVTLPWQWCSWKDSNSIDGDWSNFKCAVSTTYSIGTLDDPIASYDCYVDVTEELRTALNVYANEAHTAFYGSAVTYTSPNFLSQGNLFKSGGLFACYATYSSSHYSINTDMFNKLCTAMKTCDADLMCVITANTQSGQSVSGSCQINISDSSLNTAATVISLSGGIVF